MLPAARGPSSRCRAGGPGGGKRTYGLARPLCHRGIRGVHDLVTDADLASEKAIRGGYRRGLSRPRHPGRRSRRSAEQLQREYCWVVDPLDGTTNYVHGFPCYGVSVAVARRGRLAGGGGVRSAARGVLHCRRRRAAPASTASPFRRPRRRKSASRCWRSASRPKSCPGPRTWKHSCGLRRCARPYGGRGRRPSIWPTWHAAGLTGIGPMKSIRGTPPRAYCWFKRPAAWPRAAMAGRSS